MGHWLDALRANLQSPPEGHTTKPTEGASVGFVGARGGGISRFEVGGDHTTAPITRAAELREQVRRATMWDELYDVLDAAQMAYDAGEVSRDEVQAMLGYTTERSRQVPEHQPESRTLSDLLAERPVVRVRSRLLGEVLVWVADGVQIPEDTREAVYRESELRRLVCRSSAEVQAIHEIKRAIDGELIA